MTPELAFMIDLYDGAASKRGREPYSYHLFDGTRMLETLGYSPDGDVARAWAVHPAYQVDEYFRRVVAGDLEPTDDHDVAVLAMEYRGVANSYLTNMRGAPRLSALPAVNHMLIVDKVHNWWAARRFVHRHLTANRRRQLDAYFNTWLDVLGVNEDEQGRLERVVEVFRLCPPGQLPSWCRR